MNNRIFVPSLTKAEDIKIYAERIIDFRNKKEKLKDKEKSDFVNSYIANRVIEIFGKKKNLTAAMSDLRDYTDSSVRYFRMSGLIALRGNDTHIDIAQDKKVEVESLLESISPEAKDFSSHEDYFNYLKNPASLELPWQNPDDLNKISQHLSGVLKEETGVQDIKQYIPDIEFLTISKKVSALEKELNNVRISKLKNLKHNVLALDECILKLESITNRNYEALTSRPSLDL